MNAVSSLAGPTWVFSDHGGPAGVLIASSSLLDRFPTFGRWAPRTAIPPLGHRTESLHVTFPARPGSGEPPRPATIG